MSPSPSASSGLGVQRLSAVRTYALVLLVLAASNGPMERAHGATYMQRAFPPGAVVNLQGTPHLFVADQAGVLHWGGDTRALRDRYVDWSTRISVSLETLRTLTVGDPYLTAGLVRNGEPIYLVKWETDEALPRLLHIQCIVDVELFGIDERNYGRFVIERPAWEAMVHENRRLSVDALEKGELPPADTTAPRCRGAQPSRPDRPQLKFPSSELGRCVPALTRYGLSVGDVNAERTVTIALPPSVMSRVNQEGEDWLGFRLVAQRTAIVAQIAPLMRATSQSSADLLGGESGRAIGVIRFTRNVPVAGVDQGHGVVPGSMAANAYVVGISGGSAPRMMLTSCSDGPADAVTSMSPELRHIASREVVPPQAIVTSSAFCYSWNRVQVCMPLSARQMMTPNERGAMDQVIQDSVARLAEAGRLHVSEINTSAVLPDLEGVEAVGRRQASMLAAPAHSAAGSSAQASPLLGVIHVDLEVAIPGTAVRLPPGDYAVRLRRSGTSRTAELTSAGNTRYQLPVTAVEVLGGATRPDVALVNLVFIFPSEELPTEQLCFFFEC